MKESDTDYIVFHDVGSAATMSGGSSFTLPPSNNSISINIPDPQMARGDVQIQANDMFINRSEGVDARLNRIEAVLGITQRNPNLEDKYPDLREAGEEMDQAISEIQATLAKTISSISEAYNDFAGECEVMEKLKSKYGETD